MTTIYYTATSVDGFIADPDNSLSWLFEVPREPPSDHPAAADAFGRFLDGVGAFAMGSTTYEWLLDHERLLADPGKWSGWYADRPCWVFTHRDLPAIPGADVRFVQGDVAPIHAQMAAAAADSNIWLAGGGDLVGAFADEGLLDEIHLGVQPVFLGAGAPLLPRRLTSERVTLQSVVRDGQEVNLIYRVGSPG